MCHHFKVADQIAPGFADEFGFGAPVAETLSVTASALKDRGAWPLKRVPALRIDDAGELAAFAPEWGLLSRWWKPSDRMPKRATFQRKTINARSETAAEKPSFRDAWRRRRCLLPLVEFFERDHYFGLGEPIAFAGLWESWLGEDGEVETVTLLTTEPNAEVRGVGHHRMPCLLTTPDERRRWLVDGAESGDDPLLRRLEDGRLTVKPA